MTIASDLARAEGEARADAIVRLFNANETSGAIAERLGISRNSVMGTIHRLRAAGDPRVPPAGQRKRPMKAVASPHRAADRARPRLHPDADRVAQVMADGCPSLMGAGLRLGLSTVRVEQLWDDICRHLGPQAV